MVLERADASAQHDRKPRERHRHPHVSERPELLSQEHTRLDRGEERCEGKKQRRTPGAQDDERAEIERIAEDEAEERARAQEQDLALRRPRRPRRAADDPQEKREDRECDRESNAVQHERADAPPRGHEERGGAAPTERRPDRRQLTCEWHRADHTCQSTEWERRLPVCHCYSTIRGCYRRWE